MDDKTMQKPKGQICTVADNTASSGSSSDTDKLDCGGNETLGIRETSDEIILLPWKLQKTVSGAVVEACPSTAISGQYSKHSTGEETKQSMHETADLEAVVEPSRQDEKPEQVDDLCIPRAYRKDSSKGLSQGERMLSEPLLSKTAADKRSTSSASSPCYVDAVSWHQVNKCISSTKKDSLSTCRSSQSSRQTSSEMSLGEALWGIPFNGLHEPIHIPKAISRSASGGSQRLDIIDAGVPITDDYLAKHMDPAPFKREGTNKGSSSSNDINEHFPLPEVNKELDIPTVDSVEVSANDFRQLSRYDSLTESDSQIYEELQQHQYQPGRVILGPSSENLQDQQSEEVRCDDKASDPQKHSDEIDEDMASHWLNLFLDEIQDPASQTATKEPPQPLQKKQNEDHPTSDLRTDDSHPHQVLLPTNMFSFHPKINRRSARLAARVYGRTMPSESPVRNRFDYLHYLGTSRLLMKEAEMEAHKQVIERAELEDMCTFSPKINAHYVHSGPHTAFEDRAVKWLRMRDSRIEFSRAQSSKKELEDCTFRPNTRDSRRTMRSMLRNRHKLTQSSGSRTFRTQSGNSSLSRTASSFNHTANRHSATTQRAHLSARMFEGKRKMKDKKRNHAKPRMQECPKNEKLLLPSWTEQWCSSLGPSNMHASEISLSSDFKVSRSRTEKVVGSRHSASPNVCCNRSHTDRKPNMRNPFWDTHSTTHNSKGVHNHSRIRNNQRGGHLHSPSLH